MARNPVVSAKQHQQPQLAVSECQLCRALSRRGHQFNIHNRRTLIRANLLYFANNRTLEQQQLAQKAHV